MSVDTDRVLVTDRSIWPAITALTSCLCQTLETRGLPPVCICTPMPGEELATDYVTEDAGMAWVRLVSAYPSVSFPNAAVNASCASPLAFELEVGVAYCAPMPENDGTPPGMSAQFDAVEVQMAAMDAMTAALLCCFPGNRVDVVLNQYTPMGPQGGVVGGTWSLYVAQGVV